MIRKQLFFFGLTMVLTLGSCSKGDDNNLVNPEPQKGAPISAPIVPPTRKQQVDLVKEVEITNNKKGDITTIKTVFSYNADNTLNTVSGLKTSPSFDAEDIRYEYSNGKATAFVTQKGITGEDVYEFTLAPNEMKAISLKVTLANTEDTNRRYDFTYNELNQLVKINNKSNINHDIEEYIWEEGNPLKTQTREQISNTYKKSDILNNSNIDLNALIASYPNFINPRYAAIQGLLGVKATNLLQQYETSRRAYSYTYKLNEKGLVSQVVRTTFYKYENETETTTFDIKY
ncbi:DUF4595 domain-containing protein [Myroides phaeus]|uniref:DUF4595 domain-containing protein n=1 Tax=Myroides phaeus TaxID=702745 RepID=UPI002DB57562|nr:DUF4595 domain-containing protein [Myroides phaeus]MEC4117208.1 DUF4595 domain-containing protein [Myroides phaeus]